MDEESFRKELYHSFAAKGLPDVLKLHMRNSLVKNLQKGTYEQRKPKNDLSATLSQKIADKLVYRHLHKSQYKYTLSLFAPEAALSAADLSSSLEEILQLLNVHPGSIAFRKIKEVLVSGGDDGSDLWVVIKCLLMCFGADPDSSGTRSVSIQTGSSVFDKSSALTFSDKMRAIDEEFEERERANERSLAERLTEMGRQMEMRYEERLNEEMSRVREREVTQVRLELEERMRQQTATIKAQLECKYEERLLALQKREEANLESTRVKTQTIEKEAYHKRQFLLEQVESIRKREIALNRQADLQQRNISLMEAKVAEAEKALEMRERAVQQLETHYDTRLSQGEKRIREEIRSEYVSRVSAVEHEEERLKKQKAEIEASAEKLRRLHEIELKMEHLRVELDSALRQNELNQARLDETSDYHKLRQENIYLTEEVETLKRNLDQVLTASTRLNTDRNLMSKALSEQGPSLLGSYASARRQNVAASSSRIVPPLNIDHETQRQPFYPSVGENVVDAHTSAIVRQMATELAQLKLQLNTQQQQTSNIPASQDPAAPITAVRNTHNDSTILHDDLPDVSTSSGGDEDFLTAHRVVAGNSTMFRKQKDAMSFGGLQFLADSRSTMQNLANEADHLETRYKSYSERISMLAQETYKLPTLQQERRPAQEIGASTTTILADRGANQPLVNAIAENVPQSRVANTSVASHDIFPERQADVTKAHASEVIYDSKHDIFDIDQVLKSAEDDLYLEKQSIAGLGKNALAAARVEQNDQFSIGHESEKKDNLASAFKATLQDISQNQSNQEDSDRLLARSSDAGRQDVLRGDDSFELQTSLPVKPSDGSKTAEKDLAEVEEGVEEALEDSYSDDLEDDESENNEEDLDVKPGINLVSNKNVLENSHDVHAGGDVPGPSLAPVVDMNKSLELKAKEPAPEDQKRMSFRNVFAYSDSFLDDDEENQREKRKKKDDIFSDSDDNAGSIKPIGSRNFQDSFDDFGIEDYDDPVQVEAPSFEKQTSAPLDDGSEESF